MELRLCGIEEALWLDRASRQSLPSSPRPREHSRVGIGKSLTRRLEATTSLAETAKSPAAGMILALQGVWFESEHFIISVAHALALPAVIRHESSDEAYTIAKFVKGENGYGEVPDLLRQAGVYSVLAGPKAVQLAAWCRSNIGTELDEEVASMYGSSAIPAYRSAADALIRVFESTRTHDSDLCCWQNPRMELGARGGPTRS